MRKTAAAAAVAASLTVGGAAGVALFTPSISAAQSDETTADDTAADDTAADDTAADDTARNGAEARDAGTDDARQADRTERIGRILAPLVDDGTLTQAQADAVAERLAAADPDRPGRHHRLGLDIVDAARDVLGLEAGELRDRLAAGETLGAIAEAEGVDVDTVADALVAAHQAGLDAAVEAGRISQAQADALAARFAERVDEVVQRSFDPGIRRGPGHRHLDGADDLDGAAAEEPTDS